MLQNIGNKIKTVNKMKKIIILIILFSLNGVVSAATYQDEEFCWTPPTERESGAPLKPEEIVSYQMWHDYNGDGIKGTKLPVVLAGSNCITVTPIKANELCVDGYTLGLAGDGSGKVLQSKVSNKVCRFPKEIVIAPPPPPSPIIGSPPLPPRMLK